MNLSISPSPKRVGLTLAVLGFFIALASVICHRIDSHNDSTTTWSLTRHFDFTEEANFVNWYQSMTLLLCAALLAAIASVTRKAGRRFHRHWFVLALAFVFVSIDEVAQIHEKTITTLIAHWRPEPEAGSPEHNKQPSETEDEHEGFRVTWILVYVPILALMVALYWRFFFHLPVRTRFFFIYAATLYIGGAVGIELLGDRLRIPVADQVSELAEMLGVATFAYILMRHLEDQTSPQGDSHAK